MTIVRYDPFGTLREFDRYFRTSPFTGPVREHRTEGTWAPRVDVYNHDGSLVVKAEIPGVDPEHIEVTAEGDTLTISGSRRFETETEKTGFHRKEIFEGTFSRSVRLPKGANQESIVASSSDGILEVIVPMPAEVLPRKIAVQIDT